MRESFKKMKQNDFMKQLHYQLRRDALGTWVEITACQGTGRIINIPSEIQGYPVRAIGPRAFYHKHTLEEIRLPDTIEWIGSSAFENCTKLAVLSIPRKLRHLGNSAFCRCSALKTVHLPGSLKNVGRSSFYGCCGLKTLELDDGIEEIDDWSFYGCTALERISLPRFLVRCGRSAFDAGLTRFRQDSGSVIIDGKVLIAYAGTQREVRIPEGVTLLADGVFRGNAQIETVVFPQSLHAVGNGAFENCSKLRRAEGLEAVRFIGENAFRNCISLKSIEMGRGIVSLAKGAFSGCTSLLAVRIPDSVNCLPDECFRGCRQLAAAALPQSLTAIGSGAFEACSALQSVCIPETVRSIGDYAFYGSGLCRLTLPKEISYVGYAMLGSCENFRCMEVKAPLPNTGFLGAGADCEFCFLDTDGRIQWKALYADDLALFSGSGARDQFCGLFCGQNAQAEAFERYDCTFDLIQQKAVKLRMAMLRIAVPIALSASAAQSYQAYLRTNSSPALEQCIAARDIQMLKCFCARKIPQREAVEAALRETLSKHMVEFTAVLTAYRNTFREQSVFEKMMELSLP